MGPSNLIVFINMGASAGYYGSCTFWLGICKGKRASEMISLSIPKIFPHVEWSEIEGGSAYSCPSCDIKR